MYKMSLFKKKAIEKMGEFWKVNGSTIKDKSHNGIGNWLSDF
jgi:hypothetical protein